MLKVTLVWKSIPPPVVAIVTKISTMSITLTIPPMNSEIWEKQHFIYIFERNKWPVVLVSYSFEEVYRFVDDSLAYFFINFLFEHMFKEFVFDVVSPMSGNIENGPLKIMVSFSDINLTQLSRIPFPPFKSERNVQPCYFFSTNKKSLHWEEGKPTNDECDHDDRHRSSRLKKHGYLESATKWNIFPERFHNFWQIA